jgi:hypothetical protein
MDLNLFFALANYRSLRKELEGASSERTDWFSEIPVKGKTESHTHGQMQTFHGELAFLIRTFFFVLLGCWWILAVCGGILFWHWRVSQRCCWRGCWWWRRAGLRGAAFCRWNERS